MTIVHRRLGDHISTGQPKFERDGGGSMTAAAQRATVLLYMAMAGCSVGHSQVEDGGGPMVDVPSFSLLVKLSPAAEARLRGIGESVKVVAYFDGDPLPGKGEYNPPMRPVYLGMAERGVDDKGVAHLDRVKVPQRDFDRLSDKDYFVTVNTVSARRVAKDNLLSCADPMSVKISALQGKATEVSCRLISEAFPPR
jgi:hypothetical protein